MIINQEKWYSLTKISVNVLPTLTSECPMVGFKQWPWITSCLQQETVKLDKLTGAKFSLDFKVYQAHAHLRFIHVTTWAFIISLCLVFVYARRYYPTSISSLYADVKDLTVCTLIKDVMCFSFLFLGQNIIILTIEAEQNDLIIKIILSVEDFLSKKHNCSASLSFKTHFIILVPNELPVLCWVGGYNNNNDVRTEEGFHFYVKSCMWFLCLEVWRNSRAKCLETGRRHGSTSN